MHDDAYGGTNHYGERRRDIAANRRADLAEALSPAICPILVVNAGLVERGDELARLERLLDQARDGTGIVAVVQGPAGIGKSELLSAAAARADKRGFGVLSARAVRQDSAPGALRVAHRRAAALVYRNGSGGRVAAYVLACAPAADAWVIERLHEAAGMRWSEVRPRSPLRICYAARGARRLPIDPRRRRRGWVARVRRATGIRIVLI